MTRRQRPPATTTMLGTGQRVHAEKRPLTPSTAPQGYPVVSPALIALSEAQFQRIVRAALESRGWVVWVVPNMKLTTAGLPDLIFWHPDRPGVLHAWELKRERDYRVTPKQRAALAHLETVPGIDARLVRPSQWEALRDGVIAPAAVTREG
jgi:hypothetical protein